MVKENQVTIQSIRYGSDNQHFKNRSNVEIIHIIHEKMDIKMDDTSIHIINTHLLLVIFMSYCFLRV